MKNRTIALTASLMLMTFLSSCAAESHVPPSPDVSTSSEASDTTEEATPTETESTSTETKSFVAGKDYRRDVSNPNHTTIVGEPVLEAEGRFIDASVNKVKTKMSEEDILKAGYKICHLYREEGSNDAVLDRITAESSNEEEGKIIMMSGAAVHTLCPEHADAP